MSINEVFPNPIVKTVIFQIRYPNLFYLEDKIGDFQLEIIDKFPESSLIFEKQLVFGLGAKPNRSDEDKKNLEKTDRKLWQFKNENGVQLNVYSNSLSITSNYHKTYNNAASDYKFRDIIQFVVDNFLNIMKVPTLLRIGFRYMDELQLDELDNNKFQEYFNTVMNLDRFDISKASPINFSIRISKEEYMLNYAERVENKNNKWLVYLDFDAFKQNIKAEEYLHVTDQLHEINSTEFEAVIRQPVYDYMRNQHQN